MINVLIVDDDSKICLFFSELMEQMGHQYQIAKTIEKARLLFNHSPFDLVLLDLELPDGNGLDLLPELLLGEDAPEIIIITGTGDIRGAELAFKYGAWDYVQKPFLLNEVALPITRAVQYRKEKLSKSNLVPLERTGIIGDSNAIKACLHEVGKAAGTDASVLITGQTGTGKELFAKAIHENSKRKSKPFVAVDCGALPETLVASTLFGHEKGAFTGADKKQIGLLVQADKGTLMLDEVGDLPINAQKSLLRTLQERKVRPVGSHKEVPVDIRLVAATNLDLDQMVEQQLFRQDLLYRIRAMEIKLPPLKDRLNDVEEIVIRKFHELSIRYEIEPKAVSSEFVTALTQHDWPGNIRQLINVIEFVLASSGNDPTILPKHLPPEFRLARLEFDPPIESSSHKSATDDLHNLDQLPTLNEYRALQEKKYLKELMRQSNGDRKQACRLSGVSQSRLYGLLNKHNLPGFG